MTSILIGFLKVVRNFIYSVVIVAVVGSAIIYSVKSCAISSTHTADQRTDFSSLYQYVDSLELRKEKVLSDTLIRHFGNHPGSISYDTSYTVFLETKDPTKLTRLKKLLQKK